MPNVFKVTIVQHWLRNVWLDEAGKTCAKDTPGARFFRKRKVPSGTPGAETVSTKSAKWYGRLPGSTKAIPLAVNKVAAQQLLAAKVKEMELGKAGISDPFKEHRHRPLTDHLEDYRRHLDAKGGQAQARPRHRGPCQEDAGRLWLHPARPPRRRQGG
jgi:hypothetical protein